MYLARLFSFSLLLLLGGASLLGAKLETFYFDKQKAYRVDAVVEGELFHQEVPLSEVSDMRASEMTLGG